jgi:transposase
MSSEIQEIFERCAGIDIHKKTAVVCIMVGFAKKMKRETRTFGTMTEDLRDLAKWLVENKIKDCVIESTGPYWIPVFNILDGEFKFNVILANPYQVKNVPNRKSDVKDSEWLCKLLKNGFISKSFIPPKDIRNIREFVRLRQSYVEILTSAKNRIIKTLESRNIKLASIISDVFGPTGFKIIRLIADGEPDAKVLAACFIYKVKATHKDIVKALTGTLHEQDIKLAKLLLRHVDEHIALIKDVEKEIDFLMPKYEAEYSLLKTIPGVGDKVARVIIAEAGVNMAAFPTDQNFASWTGLTPRTNESAGKRKNTSISGGNRHIRKAFVEAAWAAVRTKNSYWHAEFHRLRFRLGVKKAIIAIARKLTECVYSVMSRKNEYQEQGAHSVESRLKESRIRYHQKKLKELGIEMSTT